MPAPENQALPPVEAAAQENEYSNYSEEELASEINTAVMDAAAASAETETAIHEAISHGSITQEESDEIYFAGDDLEFALDLADKLIYASRVNI